jgi:hypothetical protein
VLAYSQYEFIDEAGTAIRQDELEHWDRVKTAARMPCMRLGHVLWMNRFGPPIYGVFRTDVLRQTRPYGSIAADWVKLAEVAALGKIAEVPEVLFRLRRHEANTASVYKTWRELLAWHDPDLGKRSPVVPYDVAIVFEYLKGIHFLRISLLDKTMCYGVALVIPPLRGIWTKALKVSSPVRKRLQAATGWRWLSRSGASSIR